jgi:hypothetical protein
MSAQPDRDSISMTDDPPVTVDIVPRIWRGDTALFLPSNPRPEDVKAVEDRLGWLDAPVTMTARLEEVTSLRDELRRDGLTEICLLGMGGSSLCAEVFRELAPGASGTRLTLLDTTDEFAITQATSALTPERARRTAFLVATKSGTTIEVTSLEEHFWSVMERIRGASAGRHFVAITDPGTPLETLAAARGYRHTFLNRADIGGRFSALSLFGLVPAALLGWDPARLLASAREMANACRVEDDGNPGFALGRFMAGAARKGHDKLTVILPPTLAPLGSWIEQLVAESTGKDNDGVLPVVDEPFADPHRYSSDRAFVVTSTTDSAGESERIARRLETAGHSVWRIAAGEGDVASEFFRWEFATAVAGAALHLNPFNEPDVSRAKALTTQTLEDRRQFGRFTLDVAFEPGPEFSRRAVTGATSPNGRYLAVLDYLPSDAASRAAVRTCLSALRSSGRAVVTHGVGPRYLHSTGQYHKGGPNAGVFLLLTGDDRTKTDVPHRDYSFSELKYAQALGDFAALAKKGRTVLHYHLPRPPTGLVAAREDLVKRLGL